MDILFYSLLEEYYSNYVIETLSLDTRPRSQKNIITYDMT